MKLRLIEVEPAEAPVVVNPAPGGRNQAMTYCYTRDAKGNLCGSVQITFELVRPPEGSTDSLGRKAAPASNSAGLLQVALLKSATYHAWRGKGPAVTFTTGTDGSYQLPQILERP